jgi:fatty acid-binding protein DegV
MCEHFLKLNKTNKLTVDYIKKYLEENKHKIAAALIVPEIKYLVRSGRIHPAKGAIGKLLNIKVVICYTDAGLVPYKVTRNVNKLGEIAVNCIKEKLPNFTPDKIVNYSLGINGYSGKSFNLINIKNDISKLLKPPKKVRVDNLPLSAIVTCHTGPNYVLLCVKVK